MANVISNYIAPPPPPKPEPASYDITGLTKRELLALTYAIGRQSQTEYKFKRSLFDELHSSFGTYQEYKDQLRAEFGAQVESDPFSALASQGKPLRWAP